MWGDAKEAAYVALDDDRVTSVSTGNEEDLRASAIAHGERLAALFAALDQGAPLPANGIERLCLHCEMQGLCRRTHVAETLETDAATITDNDQPVSA